MAIRNIRLEKDEILKKKSREVEVIDEKIQTLIDDMIETMYKYNGVGLSAVQVGVLKRVVVIDIDDVIEIQEGFLKKIFSELMGVEIKTPLPRITWEEAMERYGSDKPDTRFGFELKKLNDRVAGCDFKVFTDALAAGGDVRGICIDGGSEAFSRKDIDKLTEAAKAYGAKGLVWIRAAEGEYNSSVNKFFSQEQLGEIAAVFDAKPGDLILI